MREEGGQRWKVRRVWLLLLVDEVGLVERGDEVGSTVAVGTVVEIEEEIVGSKDEEEMTEEVDSTTTEEIEDETLATEEDEVEEGSTTTAQTEIDPTTTTPATETLVLPLDSTETRLLLVATAPALVPVPAPHHLVVVNARTRGNRYPGDDETRRGRGLPRRGGGGGRLRLTGGDRVVGGRGV